MRSGVASLSGVTSRARLTSRVGLAALVAAWVILLAGPALAGPAAPRVLGHSNLVTSDPGAGDVVATPPTQLTLTFGEPVEASYSNVDVRDGNGAAVVTHAGAPDPTDPRTLVVPLPELADGVYTVDWRTVSATDGHGTTGFFTFGVGDVTPPSTGSSEGSSGDLHGGHGASLAFFETESRAIADLGFMLALGLAIVAFLVLRSAAIAPALAYALGLAAFGSATLGLVGATSLDASPIEFILNTRTGLLLIGRIVVALLGISLVLAALRVSRPRLGLVAGGIAGFVGIGLIVLGGHAAGFAAAAPLLAAMVHVCSAGIWLSGLAVVAWAALLPSPDRPLREVVPRFSALALIALGLVAVTGAYADWLLTGALLRFDSPYALALLLKIVIVLAALVIGAVNYLDGGRGKEWFGGFHRRVVVEAGVALVIVVATGNLASGSPPGVAAPVAIAPAFSSATSAQATLSLVPGRPGPARFLVTVPGAPPIVTLVLTQAGGGSGTSRISMRPGDGSDVAEASATGRSTFVSNGGLLPAGTGWDSTVIVSDMAGAETGRTRFVFAMDTAGVAEGRASPAVNVGLLLAIALLAGAILLAAFTVAGGSLPRVERRTGRLAAAVGSVVAAVLAIAILMAGVL